MVQRHGPVIFIFKHNQNKKLITKNALCIYVEYGDIYVEEC